MKRLFIALTCLGLTGCFDDTSDLREFTAAVKSSTVPVPEKMPAIPVFKHVAYAATTQRSPFMAPRPEVIQDSIPTVQNCLTPNVSRRKEPLEQYPMDNLSMRGTLGLDSSLWALVEAADGSLHRVRDGNFLGLYNGQITLVTEQQLKVTELIPDGTGCWKERETVLTMVDPGQQ